MFKVYELTFGLVHHSDHLSTPAQFAKTTAIRQSRITLKLPKRRQFAQGAPVVVPLIGECGGVSWGQSEGSGEGSVNGP